jgi:myo-inositol-1(or 4)-monophosphatase
MSDNVLLATRTDATLLGEVVAIVEAAGALLTERFTTAPPRLDTLDEVIAAIHANDDAVLAVLREPLLAARPGSRWVDDELAGGALPPGEWWVVDPAEGNINHLHGMTDWCVTATLVRDDQPVLTVVHLPLVGTTYTAVAGGGAHQDGVPLRPSAKTPLDAAMVGTGQARPGESDEAFRRIGESVTAMLIAGLVVRVSVPATLQLIHCGPGAVMKLTILATSGATGLELTRQALERGHTVTAIARDPKRVIVPVAYRLTVRGASPLRQHDRPFRTRHRQGRATGCPHRGRASRRASPAGAHHLAGRHTGSTVVPVER